MTRTAAIRTGQFSMFASVLTLAVAGAVRPSTAAGHCPLSSGVQAPYGRVAVESAPELRSALLTYADEDLAQRGSMLTADPHWARLTSVPGLRPQGSRL